MSDREIHTQSEEPAESTRQFPVAPASAATDTDTAPPHEAAAADDYVLVADGLSVVGEEGPVFGPIDLRVPDNTLVFLSGRGGSGRTALALTLAGRMKPTDGTLTVFGHDQLKDIRDTVAIAGVDVIDALDRDVRVRDVLTDHRAWCHGWFGWVPKADDAYREEILSKVYGSRSLPDLNQYVSQIPALDRILIRIGMALHPAHDEKIRLLILDDLEQVRELSDRAILLSVLNRLSTEMTVLVNSVNPPSAATLPGSQVIELFTDRGHIAPESSGATDQHLEDLLARWTALRQGDHPQPRHAKSDTASTTTEPTTTKEEQ
ncbi:ATP-binding cassette domain-containing protein [Corynebacterium sp. TAE3-ERU30]|uniref:ATP-binding cassette domain-containing protein n=1 Tax=Corynebacterium sp. TAE3-ERU30 TaxID=2849496 RepID=UPI001C487F77|nr:ATP-binding cassette domain-containing protein [Corynebacterium sp. TAE3-ERU30]MBV7282474.1 ABC transporter ATP-binding protein [Corynebacterium sp. TAE3-ERU30]